MLIGLINRHIKPYWPQLVLIVILQAGAQVAALTLPTIANIINNGVVTLDTHYVKTHSAVMLGVAAVQALCQIVAVYLAARTAMGFGRDVRDAVFDRALSFLSLIHISEPTRPY